MPGSNRNVDRTPRWASRGVRVEGTSSAPIEPTGAANTGAGMTAYTFPTPPAAPLAACGVRAARRLRPRTRIGDELPPFTPELR